MDGSRSCPDKKMMLQGFGDTPVPVEAEFLECPVDCPGPAYERVTIFGGRMKLWNVEVCPLRPTPEAPAAENAERSSIAPVITEVTRPLI